MDVRVHVGRATFNSTIDGMAAWTWEPEIWASDSLSMGEATFDSSLIEVAV